MHSTTWGKAACERAFGVIRQLLFEKLPGYTGVDVADRGADPEGDAQLTVEEMEHLIASWIVAWQNRVLQDCPPAWDPDGTHSPNTLFAAAFAQAGLALEVPRPELFYELLPAHYVSVDKRRGVKIRGLWYDDPDVLRDDYRGTPSSRGGQHKGKWLIRRDPRDRRAVFFQDPFSHAWHPLPWTGLPGAGQVPAFGDARVRELMKTMRDCGLKPRTDAELLPVLLELIGSAVPVGQWPTQMSKAQRTGHAREAAQADAAVGDRPEGREGKDPGRPGKTAPASSVVTPLRWPERSRSAGEALDAERRRRREEAVPLAPGPPRPQRVPAARG